MTMETTKEIKDYLYLYLGCDVQTGEGIQRLVLTTNNDDNNISLYLAILIKVKPLLRKLNDITEEEKQVIENMGKLYMNHSSKSLPSYELSKRWAADQTVYLLKHHFDLFGLIEAGLAIDATKLKKMEV